MNNQIEIRNTDITTTLQKVGDLLRLVEALMKTKHYQALGEAGVFAVSQKAMSLDLNVLDALNGGLYYINGKVGMASETMARLIRQAGHSISKDPKSDNTVCILHGKRKDTGDTWTCSFSLEDAKRAGLLRNSYEKYPAAMLYNRAMSFLARQLFPDVIKGAGYTADELKEIRVENIVEQEIKAPEIVSKEQSDILKQVLSECSLEYQETVYNFMKERLYIDSLERLPSNLFDRVYNAAIKKANEKNTKEQEIIVEAVA